MCRADRYSARGGLARFRRLQDAARHRADEKLIRGSNSRENAKKTLAYISSAYPAVRSIWSGWSDRTREARVELLWLAAFDAIHIGDAERALLTPHYICGACANFVKKAQHNDLTLKELRAVAYCSLVHAHCLVRNPLVGAWTHLT